jgi:hypothetical protein
VPSAEEDESDSVDGRGRVAVRPGIDREAERGFDKEHGKRTNI